MNDKVRIVDSLLGTFDVYRHSCTSSIKKFSTLTVASLYKRYSKIDQHLARRFKFNVGCLSSPPHFLYLIVK